MPSGGHATSVSSQSPSVTAGRRALDALRQRFDEDGRTLEHQTFRRPHHAVDDRPFEHLAAHTHHHPAEAGEPAAVMKRPQEARAVGDILYGEVDVQAVRSRHRGAVVRAVQSRAG